MDHFDVSEQYSRTLDQVRGPGRRRRPLKRIRAWALQTAGRRSAARFAGAGAASAFVLATGYMVAQRARKAGLR